MDIQFVDSSESPLPPEEVRLKHLGIEPYPDQRRFRVDLELTPFQQRPDVELKLADEAGRVIASTDVIESIDHRIQLTMHTPRPLPAGEYRLLASASYEAQVIHEQEITFQLD